MNQASGDVELESAAGLVINELMAVNNAIKDADGHFDDWIELLNTSDREIGLGDVSLSDDENKFHKWTFPPDARIAPGELLLVWADGDVKAASGLHASFKLSKNGESLFLSRRNGPDDVLLDKVSFGRQRAGVSFGRASAGSTFEPLVPTPGEPNRTTD